jgi:hypothetical protein
VDTGDPESHRHAHEPHERDAVPDAAPAVSPRGGTAGDRTRGVDMDGVETENEDANRTPTPTLLPPLSPSPMPPLSQSPMPPPSFAAALVAAVETTQGDSEGSAAVPHHDPAALDARAPAPSTRPTLPPPPAEQPRPVSRPASPSASPPPHVRSLSPPPWEPVPPPACAESPPAQGLWALWVALYAAGGFKALYRGLWPDLVRKALSESVSEVSSSLLLALICFAPCP